MSRRQKATVNYLNCTVPVFAGRDSRKAQIFFSKDSVSNSQPSDYSILGTD